MGAASVVVRVLKGHVRVRHDALAQHDGCVETIITTRRPAAVLGWPVFILVYIQHSASGSLN